MIVFVASMSLRNRIRRGNILININSIMQSLIRKIIVCLLKKASLANEVAEMVLLTEC
jgi:hypothetical protein